MRSTRTILSLLEASYIDLIGYFAVFFAIIIFFFNNAFYNYFGVVVCICGFFMWIKGRIDIGISFQILPEAKRLVTSGIYSKIRNPIYLGGLIVDVGLIIYTLHSFISYILFVYTIFFVLVQAFRIKREEKALRDKFGYKYIKYSNKTWI